MGESQIVQNVQTEPDARVGLTTRVIPTMTLSSASNPLTAPLPSLYGSQRSIDAIPALARFAVPGHAVITGGAGTLALASARALLEHGCFGVALLDLSPTLTSSADLISALQSDFPERIIKTIHVDVTDEDQVNDAMATANIMLGGTIDILCCFAGVVGCVPSIEVSGKEWKRVLDINLNGSFLCAKAAAQFMISSAAEVSELTQTGSSPPAGIPGKSMLFISSISSATVNFPQPQASYNTSKAGVRHLTRCLAAEWAVHGIRVNCISPGYMDTILNAGDSLQAVRDVWASRCPMGRMGDVEELTGAVVMLCSPRAGRYMTGSEVVVDGGALCF